MEILDLYIYEGITENGKRGDNALRADWKTRFFLSVVKGHCGTAPVGRLQWLRIPCVRTQCNFSFLMATAQSSNKECSYL